MGPATSQRVEQQVPSRRRLAREQHRRWPQRLTQCAPFRLKPVDLSKSLSSSLRYSWGPLLSSRTTSRRLSTTFVTCVSWSVIWAPNACCAREDTLAKILLGLLPRRRRSRQTQPRRFFVRLVPFSRRKFGCCPAFPQAAVEAFQRSPGLLGEAPETAGSSCCVLSLPYSLPVASLQAKVEFRIVQNRLSRNPCE